MNDGKKRLLLIDTCGAEAAVGLSEGEALVDERKLAGREASAQIAAVVKRLLANRGWRLTDLGGVGVVGGPGSFTGMRTGLAFAKGLCQVSGLPLAVVSRLEVLARGAGLQRGLAVLAAGSGEFYWRHIALAREQIGGTAEVMEIAGDMEIVAGEERVLEALAEHRTAQGAALRLHKMTLAAALPSVTECLAHGGSDVASSDANYVRGEAHIYRKSGAAE